MKTLIKIAWRNIWRNKKRTILTMASIFIAIVLALFMRSMQKGTYVNMINGAVKFSTGYVQIHKIGYWKDKTINNTFEQNDKIKKAVDSVPEITISLPRLESFALASSGQHSKGVLVMGINPNKEKELNHLNSRLIKGNYLTDDDQQILVSEKLAEFLSVSLGDTLVLLGQGYHGVSAVGQYKIKGIVKFPVPELNNKLVYLPLKEAQFFYAADNMITSETIMIDNIENLQKVKSSLQENLAEEYEIMTWDEMNPEVVQAIQGDNAGGIIMLTILYIVVGFGVLGTMLMMTMERKKEFAVMIAVGLQKSKLALIVLFETIFIGVVSIFSGLAFTTPFLIYYHFNPIRYTGDTAASFEAFGVEPIIPFSLNPDIFSSQAITVFIITIIAILYPLYIIYKFNVLKGMRS